VGALGRALERLARREFGHLEAFEAGREWVSEAKFSYDRAISSIACLAIGSSSCWAMRRASSARRRQYAGSLIGERVMVSEHSWPHHSSSWWEQP